MPENWSIFTGEYQEAVNLIVDFMVKTRKRNFMVFPVIFLFRHYIELMLKEIIVNNWEYLGVSRPFPKGHDIYRLWGICRKALQETDKLVDQGFARSKDYAEQTVKAYDALEADLNKFAEIDPDSEHFRYPVDTKGEPIVLKEELLIEILRDLPELVKRISENLDGISSGIYTILQNKYDGLAQQGYS